MIGSLLDKLADFSWTAHTTMVSLFLFGECEYPTEE